MAQAGPSPRGPATSIRVTGCTAQSIARSRVAPYNDSSRTQVPVALGPPFGFIGECREPRQHESRDAIGRGRRRVLNRLGSRGEIRRPIRRRDVEIAGRIIGVRRAAVGHHRGGAIEPGGLTGGFAGFEEGRCGLHIVVEHAARFEASENVGHPAFRIPRLVPDPFENSQRQLIALRPVEHGTGLKKRTGHHRVPVHVCGAVHKGCLPAVPPRLELLDRGTKHRPFIVSARVLLPPQHILLRVVMHLPDVVDVKHVRRDREFSRHQRCFGLIHCPRPIIAVVSKCEIRIL